MWYDRCAMFYSPGKGNIRRAVVDYGVIGVLAMLSTLV